MLNPLLPMLRSTVASRVLAAPFAASVLTLTALSAAQPQPPPPTITTTSHAQLPADWSQVWLAPDANPKPSPALRDLAAAVKAYDAGQFRDALLLLSKPALLDTPVPQWVRYYRALSL